MRVRHQITTAAIAVCCMLTAKASNQETASDSLYHYNIELAATTGSRQTPFWLLNNRYGLSSIEKNNGYLRAGFFREKQYDRRFSWDFGADVAVAGNFSSTFIIQQLYAGIRYRSLDLTIGSKERTSAIVNEKLGSGDMLFSQNAHPIPEVRLSMPEYNYVPYTNDWLAVKGYFSFGMYTDWRWQRNHTGPEGDWSEHLLFHSKGLFLRGGNPDRFPLTVEGGLEMGAQFGGTVYRTNPVTGERETVKLPHGIKDIIKVIIPTSGGDSGDTSQMGEINNVYGNHTGQWSLAAAWKPKDRDWGLRMYYEHFFEDHSMMFFDHAWRDMLLGVEISLPKNPVISTFVYEYITTKDQSGAVYWDTTSDIPEQVSGRDNYYNHYLMSGWQHWGMGQGNPLLISPAYNSDGSLTFMHNRIKGHHFGWEGRPHPDVDYRVLLTYTRSWGTYNNPTPTILHNFNALLEVTYSPHKLPGWTGRIGLAADGGRLLGKNFGAMLTISKTGWL